jgi:adenylate cyclase
LEKLGKKIYTKEIERKWLVNKKLLPTLDTFEKVELKYGYLSQPTDSLEVRVLSIDDKLFYLTLKDKGNKIRNEIEYKITKDEFLVSYALSGNKTLDKTRYMIPSSVDSNMILELDVFADDNLVVVEFEHKDETVVDSFVSEKWFGDEITDDPDYKTCNIAYKKAYS